MAPETESPQQPSPRRPRAGLSRTWRFVIFGALCGLIFGAWWTAERHAGAWLAAHVHLFANLGADDAASERALTPLVAQGDPRAPLQVVLACDLADAPCRAALGWLIDWQQSDPERDVLPGRHSTRIVFLNRSAEDAGTVDVAAAFAALDLQHRFWAVAEAVADSGRAFALAAVGKALQETGGDVTRWKRDQKDPEQLLRARIDRTMAAGLGIPSPLGALASGLPMGVEALRSQADLQRALHQRALELAKALTASKGDVERAQHKLLAGRDRRQVERYQQWVLHGERVAVLQPAPIRRSSP